MIRTSEELDALNAALAEFHKELPDVTKDAENPHFKNRFASLAANIKAADKKAAGHGLSVQQLMTFVDSQHGLYDALATRISHSSGQWMEAVQIMHLPKEDPQGQGSAMTYGRRYNYQGAYGLAAEDDDAQSAANAVEKSGSTRSNGSFNKSATDKQIGLIKFLVKECHLNEQQAVELIDGAVGRPTRGFQDLSMSDAGKVIDKLNETKDAGLVTAGFGASEEAF